MGTAPSSRDASALRVVTLSHLFPNNEFNTQGLFVLERVLRMAAHADVATVAPVPWLPFGRLFPRYARAARVLAREEVRGLSVLHPRFLVLPGLHVLSAVSYALRLLFHGPTRRLLKSADVLDVHWTFPDGFAALLLARLYRKPLCITVRGNEAFYLGQGRLRQALVRRSLRSCAGVITVSEDLRQKVLRRTGLAPQDVQTVPNGVDLALFRPGNRAEARRALGLDGGHTIMLSIGRICAAKGIHHLVERWSGVRARFPDARLYIIGEPDPEGGAAYHRALAERIRSEGLEDAIVFAGKVPPARLAEWYVASDFLALISEGEGCPNVVLEALACGRPVLATSVGGVPDLVNHPGVGVLVAEDKGDLSAKMLEIHARDWDEGFIRGRMEERSWDWCAKNALDAIRRFLNSQAGP